MVDRRSLRGRLTLTFTAALLLTLFVAGAGALGLVHWSQRTEVDGRLVRIADTLSSWASWRDGVFQSRAIDARAAARLNGTLAESSIFARDGAVLFSTTPAIPDVLRRAIVGAHGSASTGDFAAAPNVWRASIAPVVRDGKTLGMSVAWHDVLLDRSFEQRVAFMFLAGAPIVAIFAFGIAAWAARRGLRPLDDMVGAVEEIEAHALSRRIPEARMPRELERFAHAFNHMLGRLEAAFARERQFTADASHELRAPLSVIGATAEYALETHRDSADYRRALQSIELEANDLGRLMHDLLASARSEATVPASDAPCDIGAVAFDVVEELYPLARKRSVAVEHPHADELLVALDAEKMTRVVRAILDNAIRHASDGGKRRRENSMERARGDARNLRRRSRFQRSRSATRDRALLARRRRARPGAGDGTRTFDRVRHRGARRRQPRARQCYARRRGRSGEASSLPRAPVTLRAARARTRSRVKRTNVRDSRRPVIMAIIASSAPWSAPRASMRCRTV